VTAALSEQEFAAYDMPTVHMQKARGFWHVSKNVRAP